MADPAPDTNTPLERLKRRFAGTTTPDDLLLEATDFVKNYIGLPAEATLPAALTSATIRIATALYNKLGVEGQSAHSEGGVSITIKDLPDDLAEELNRHRTIKVGW